MLLKLLGVLAIVVIKDLSDDIIQRLTKWIEKQDPKEEK